MRSEGELWDEYSALKMYILQLTWIDSKWFPSKYCSTLEIIFVHYN